MGKIGEQRVVAAACRLRAIQRGFADADGAIQAEHLGEELNRQLDGIPYGERRVFLQDLLKEFPVWHVGFGGSVASSPKSDEREPASEDPTCLAENLVRRFSSVSPDQKEAILSVLRGVVTDVPDTEAARNVNVADIRSKLRLPSDATVHLDRVGTLLNYLIEVVIKLERLTATVWTKMAARSGLRPPKSIEQTASRFLSEDDNSGRELAKELRLLLEFTTAIMTATSKVPDAVGGRYARRFSPEAIRALVEMEQSRLRDTLLTKEFRCWRKYCELAEALSAGHIEQEIESTMADCAEAFVRGLERRG